MKKITKKLLVFMLLFATFTTSAITVNADNDDIRPSKIMKIICTDSSIKVGDEFELKARTNPYDADDDYLRWSIVGKKGIVRFEDIDNNDDEVEFVALKAGTTKIRCSIKGKSKKYSKTIKIKVKKAEKSKKISRIGAKTITVEAGDDFDLEVKKGKGVKERDLKWSIKNTSIVDFDDDYNDRQGDDVDLYALKAGTTVVTCKNTKTGTVIRYTVKVVNYDVDDDDDD